MCHSIQRPNGRNIRAGTPWHCGRGRPGFLHWALHAEPNATPAKVFLATLLPTTLPTQIAAPPQPNYRFKHF